MLVGESVWRLHLSLTPPSLPPPDSRERDGERGGGKGREGGFFLVTVGGEGKCNRMWELSPGLAHSRTHTRPHCAILCTNYYIKITDHSPSPPPPPPPSPLHHLTPLPLPLPGGTGVAMKRVGFLSEMLIFLFIFFAVESLSWLANIYLANFTFLKTNPFVGIKNDQKHQILTKKDQKSQIY